MKKGQFLWFIVAIILVSAVVLRLTSREDDWLCKNGDWVKHGQPRAPKPTALCPRSFSEPISSSTIAAPTIATSTVSTSTTATSTVPQEEVIIANPKPNDIVKSPLSVTGQARGNWFFEANIPVKLVDAENKVIASIGGQAQGEWMTENLVSFTAQLAFKTTATSGYLVISKDNPSGLPQNDASVSIPVRFK